MLLQQFKVWYGKVVNSTGTIKRKFQGRDLLIVRGTIKSKPDYDDAWFFALSKQSKVVFDLGCNVGFTTILTKLANPRAKVVLVDPNPKAIGVAFRNMLSNNFLIDCHFICAFVDEKSGQDRDFYTIGTGAAGSFSPELAHSAGKLSSKISTNSISVDDIVNSLNLIPDLVKIDIEGAEQLALNGSIRLAKLSLTRFLVEMHSSASMSMLDNCREVLAWCKMNNYSAWYLKEKLLITEPEIVAHRGRCHLLLQPTSWPFPSSLDKIHQGDIIH